MRYYCDRCGVETQPLGESDTCVECHEVSTHFVGQYTGCDYDDHIRAPCKEKHDKYLYWYGVKSMECNLCHMIFKVENESTSFEMVMHKRFHFLAEERDTIEGEINWIRGYC